MIFFLYISQALLGTNQHQIESFITKLANSPEPEKLIDVTNQVVQLSRSESIPIEDLGNHVNQQRFEEAIKVLRIEKDPRKIIKGVKGNDMQIRLDQARMVDEIFNSFWSAKPIQMHLLSLPLLQGCF